jgi:TPR repeat protein
MDSQSVSEISALGRDENSTDVALTMSFAAEGDPGSQAMIGYLYLVGEGVEQDDVEAERWLWRAAMQGSADAAANLGWMHENGRGVERDDGEAAKWYRQAAELGAAEAQTNLGWMYERGRGVSQNDA